MSVIYYPIIRIPNGIKRARVVKLEEDGSASPKHNSVIHEVHKKPFKPKLKGLWMLIAETSATACIAIPVALLLNNATAGLLILVAGSAGSVAHGWLLWHRFHARVKRYQQALTSYNAWEQAQKQGAKTKKQAAAKAQQQEEELSLAKRSALLVETLRATVGPDGRDSSAKRGRSEADFEVVLRQYFPGHIHTGLTLKISPEFPHPYTPDFALIDPKTNLHLDIEIDEPYNSEGQPVHYVGLDDNRNEFFLERNWILMRFAEEQVIRYPEACCKLIAKILVDVIGDATALKQLHDVAELPKVKQWTQKEAKLLAKMKHRGSY